MSLSENGGKTIPKDYHPFSNFGILFGILFGIVRCWEEDLKDPYNLKSGIFVGAGIWEVFLCALIHDFQEVAWKTVTTFHRPKTWRFRMQNYIEDCLEPKWPLLIMPIDARFQDYLRPNTHHDWDHPKAGVLMAFLPCPQGTDLPMNHGPKIITVLLYNTI